MKYFFLLFALLPLADVTAQNADSIPSPWKRRLEIGLNLNQASFTPNWKGGGTNNFALGTLASGSLSYTQKKFSWMNDLQLQYGFQQNKGQTRRKTQDLVFIDSKVGYEISQKLNAFGAVNFVSQFAPGLNYSKDPAGNEIATVISRWMAPGYLTQSFGIQYKPVDYFMVRMGALAARQTFVTDPVLSAAGAFGVDSGLTLRVDYGYQIVASFDKNLAKNLNLKARYLSFGDYADFSKTNHRLDLIVAARVTKYINTNLTAVMLYDRNQDLAVQWSQVLALGVLFQLR
jgi:hypothetical protein